MEKSSDPFSLGGDNLKRYFELWFLNAQEAVLLIYF